MREVRQARRRAEHRAQRGAKTAWPPARRLASSSRQRVRSARGARSVCASESRRISVRTAVAMGDRHARERAQRRALALPPARRAARGAMPRVAINVRRAYGARASAGRPLRRSASRRTLDNATRVNSTTATVECDDAGAGGGHSGACHARAEARVTAPRQRSKRSRAQPSFVQAAAADRLPLGAAAPPRRPRRGGSRRRRAGGLFADYCRFWGSQYRQLSRFITRKGFWRGGATRGLHRVERVETGSLADGADSGDARGRRRRWARRRGVPADTAHRAQRLVGAPSAARRKSTPPPSATAGAGAADAAEHVALAPPAGPAARKVSARRSASSPRSARRAPRRRRADRARCDAAATDEADVGLVKSSSSAKPSVGSPASARRSERRLGRRASRARPRRPRRRLVGHDRSPRARAGGGWGGEV